MRGRRLLFLAGLALPLGLAPGSALAADGAGTVTVFQEGPSPRALALGGAYTAVADDPGAMTWNPAGLGFIDRKTVAVSRTSYYGLDMVESFAGFALPSWKYGVLDITLRHFGVGGIEGRDDRNQLVNPELTDDEMELALGYARAFGEAWSLGGTVRYYRQNLAGFSGSAAALDVGFLAYPGRWIESSPTWADRIRTGVSVRNLVDGAWTLNQTAVEERPTGRLGLAYEHPWPDRRLLFAVDLEKTREADPILHAGVEFEYRSLVALRTGLTNSAFTVGAGVTWRDIGFLYTYEDNGLGGLHRLGLSYGFGATTEEAYHASLRKQQAEIETRLAEEYSRRQAERTQTLLADAESERTAGDLEGALETLAVAATLAPENEQVRALELSILYEKAGILEVEGRYTDAALLYGRIQGMAGAGPQAAEGLARCQDEIAARAARTESLREAFATSLDAFSRGDLLAARRGFRGILVEEPGDSEAEAMLDRTDQAIARRTEELLDQARRFAAGGLVEPAEEALAQARALDPGDPAIGATARAVAAARNRVTVVSAGGDTVRAAGGDRPPLSPERQREIADLYERGLAALGENRGEDAIRYWEIVAGADPDYLDVRSRLKEQYLMTGMDAFAAGNLDGAIDVWERALLLDPEDARTQGYLVRARQQLARTREILGETGGVRGQ